jgi:hypothetical protein
MKKKICLALMAAMIFGAGAVGAEGVYVAPAGVGTRITSLPYPINNSGYYYFGGNLNINLASGNAITVSANNVTIDLMGFNLTNTHASASANGIYMSGQNNVEIRNGTLVNFQEAIEDNSGAGANYRICNMRLNNNVDAIYLRGNNHLVKDCNASKNYVGISIDSGTISNCVTCDNTNIGIRLPGAGSVLGNIANNNTNHNFYLGTASTATNITVNRNSATGLMTNYYIPSGSTGVVFSFLNAGTP